MENDLSFIKRHNTLSDEQKKKIEEEVAGKFKNWVSYGFSYTDPDKDKYLYNAVQFLVFSVLCCSLVFVLMYTPKAKEKDWCMREAFLELERREKLGLHLIDPNYAPLERIVLPTEEELINVKIII